MTPPPIPLPQGEGELTAKPSGASPRRLVATIGMHASASTWVFNIVRELLIAAVGEASLLTLYADERAQIPDSGGRHLLIKSHHGSVGLDEWLAASDARILLSVRDPRDAAVSMALRFKAPLASTVRWIANDCNRLLRLAPQKDPLFRYEDRFFANRAAVAWIDNFLGLHTAPDVQAAIFERYSTEAVQAFARTLEQLPPERLQRVSDFPMDRVTQILGPHIGDTRSGKWQGLAPALQQELTRVFRPFLDRFGYPC